MALWPATLPAPLSNTLRESPPDNTLRTATDKGPAKVRRRTTASIRPISFQLALTPAQLADLDAFYVTTTASGSDEFTYTHPRTSVVHSARFVEPPSYSDMNTGMLYEASISLELMP